MLAKIETEQELIEIANRFWMVLVFGLCPWNGANQWLRLELTKSSELFDNERIGLIEFDWAMTGDELNICPHLKPYLDQVIAEPLIFLIEHEQLRKVRFGAAYANELLQWVKTDYLRVMFDELASKEPLFHALMNSRDFHDTLWRVYRDNAQFAEQCFRILGKYANTGDFDVLKFVSEFLEILNEPRNVDAERHSEMTKQLMESLRVMPCVIRRKEDSP